MGSSSSRLDRFAGTYEKSFARIEKDVERLKVQAAARAKRKARLSRWCSAAVLLAVAVAVAIIYQVQRQPLGYYSYQQHLHRVGGAMALPLVAFAVQWLLVLLLGIVESRDSTKLKSLEAAKRSMIKELKEMTRYDKIKALIDKFDPDAPALPTAAMIMAGQLRARDARAAGLWSRRAAAAATATAAAAAASGNQMPALLAKGSGQVAGAAAFAVAGAGKAIMPLFDKLATTLISDNPMLLEDLRRTQMQVQDAEIRMIGALQESCNVKFENISLKQRLIELEKQLDVPLSFDAELLQEQLQQQHAHAQQLPWVMQQCIPPEQQHLLLEGPPGQDADAAAGAGRGGSGSWPGATAAAGSSWGADGKPLPQQGAISSPETPGACAAAAAAGSSKQGVGGSSDAAAAGGAGAATGSSMGEGLESAAADEAGDSGLRQRRGITAA
ncbi:hypothetical protein COO60DRAFT_1699220 [Scenedesmus sp. NREL 46B-D3]|nr:hypothetical protein COO60DRAFT_1699220 [Scenedesmus sp. NREL 46B-D3]